MIRHFCQPDLGVPRILGQRRLKGFALRFPFGETVDGPIFHVAPKSVFQGSDGLPAARSVGSVACAKRAVVEDQRPKGNADTRNLRVSVFEIVEIGCTEIGGIFATEHHALLPKKPHQILLRFHILRAGHSVVGMKILIELHARGGVDEVRLRIQHGKIAPVALCIFDRLTRVHNKTTPPIPRAAREHLPVSHLHNALRKVFRVRIHILIIIVKADHIRIGLCHDRLEFVDRTERRFRWPNVGMHFVVSTLECSAQREQTALHSKRLRIGNHLRNIGVGHTHIHRSIQLIHIFRNGPKHLFIILPVVRSALIKCDDASAQKVSKLWNFLDFFFQGLEKPRAFCIGAEGFREANVPVVGEGVPHGAGLTPLPHRLQPAGRNGAAIRVKPAVREAIVDDRNPAVSIVRFQPARPAHIQPAVLHQKLALPARLVFTNPSPHIIRQHRAFRMQMRRERQRLQRLGNILDLENNLRSFEPNPQRKLAARTVQRCLQNRHANHIAHLLGGEASGKIIAITPIVAHPQRILVQLRKVLHCDVVHFPRDTRFLHENLTGTIRVHRETQMFVFQSYTLFFHIVSIPK